MKIRSAEYITSGTTIEHFPEHTQNEYVLCGRSNVGKSSFINGFLNRKNLAYTSSKPGKTQAISFFHINEDFYFVDVPGYGYAKVSQAERQKFGEMIENYLVNREQLKAVIMLIDLRHGPSEDDILMYDFLKYYDLDIIVICTKKDKIPKTHLMRHKKVVLDKLGITNEEQLFLVSSETKEGFEDVANLIEEKELKDN